MKCPRGTVAIRLQRAREMLRGRLTRRGLTLTAALTAVLTAERTASAALPAALVHSTLKASLLFAAGKMVTGAVSSQALTMAYMSIKVHNVALQSQDIGGRGAADGARPAQAPVG